MKTNRELLGDIIIYPIIVIACLVAFPLLFVAGIIAVIICAIAVIFLLCYALVYLIGGSIWLGIDYLFFPQKENIEGKVVALIAKKVPLPNVPNNIGGENNFHFSFLQPPIFVTDYFLRIKNGMQWYTIKVPKYFFEEIKEQRDKGINTISLLCEKYNFDEENVFRPCNV